jgi:RES domain-containing protein
MGGVAEDQNRFFTAQAGNAHLLERALIIAKIAEVKVKEHPGYANLLSAMKIATARASAWSGPIFRSAPPKWATAKNLLSGIGSMKSGGRFNATGGFPAVYGSTTPELAMIESLAYQRRANVPVERAMPLVFKALAVDVRRALDLTDPSVLRDLGLTLEQLCMGPWWLCRARGEESLTQAVGRAAHACRVQAILAASAHDVTRGINVVVLPDHLDNASHLKMLRHAKHRGP